MVDFLCFVGCLAVPSIAHKSWFLPLKLFKLEKFCPIVAGRSTRCSQIPSGFVFIDIFPKQITWSFYRHWNLIGYFEVQSVDNNIQTRISGSPSSCPIQYFALWALISHSLLNFPELLVWLSTVRSTSVGVQCALITSVHILPMNSYFELCNASQSNRLCSRI